ncbi:MAG: peptide ABC transporter permease, partial [Candidatus Pacebacteria bacterium]|nr:peptide ABC transporter permease [Candidatus Paceibacterota bacterium]
MRKLSPEVKEGFRRFRHQRRAYYSFIVLTVLFLLSLPAELLCNSKPLLIYCNGRFYFPVFKTYTAQDFGGDRQVEPDYQSRYF